MKCIKCCSKENACVEALDIAAGECSPALHLAPSELWQKEKSPAGMSEIKRTTVSPLFNLFFYFLIIFFKFCFALNSSGKKGHSSFMGWCTPSAKSWCLVWASSLLHKAVTCSAGSTDDFLALGTPSMQCAFNVLIYIAGKHMFSKLRAWKGNKGCWSIFSSKSCLCLS